MKIKISKDIEMEIEPISKKEFTAIGKKIQKAIEKVLQRSSHKVSITVIGLGFEPSTGHKLGMVTGNRHDITALALTAAELNAYIRQVRSGKNDSSDSFESAEEFEIERKNLH